MHRQEVPIKDTLNYYQLPQSWTVSLSWVIIPCHKVSEDAAWDNRDLLSQETHTCPCWRKNSLTLSHQCCQRGNSYRWAWHFKTFPNVQNRGVKEWSQAASIRTPHGDRELQVKPRSLGDCNFVIRRLWGAASGQNQCLNFCVFVPAGYEKERWLKFSVTVGKGLHLSSKYLFSSLVPFERIANKAPWRWREKKNTESQTKNG